MKEVFAKCIPFNNNKKGRIGGNPPILIQNQVPNEYKFYATLVHPEKTNKMLSILIHQNFETLITNNIYPNIAVKVFEHDFSAESNFNEKSIKDISTASISDYKNQLNNDDFPLIRVGGEPVFIQHKDYYKQLVNDNYSFLLQIDEEGYSDDLLTGDYPFSYGSLFLYKQNATGEVIAGFWQYS